MTLDDYRELEPETFLHKGDYDEQGIQTDILHAKWYGFYLREKKKLRGLQGTLNRVLLQRTKFYLGKTPIPYEHVVLESELSRYLEADDEALQAQENVDEQQDLVAFIEEVMKRINQRRYTITNNIKWVKFENGQNDFQ